MPLRFDWPQWWDSSIFVVVVHPTTPTTYANVQIWHYMELFHAFFTLIKIALLLWGCWGCWHKSSRLCLPRENRNPECCWGDPSNSTSSCSNSLGPWPKPNKPIPDDTIFSGKVRLADFIGNVQEPNKKCEILSKDKAMALGHFSISMNILYFAIWIHF